MERTIQNIIQSYFPEAGKNKIKTLTGSILKKCKEFKEIVEDKKFEAIKNMIIENVMTENDECPKGGKHEWIGQLIGGFAGHPHTHLSGIEKCKKCRKVKKLPKGKTTTNATKIIYLDVLEKQNEKAEPEIEELRDFPDFNGRLTNEIWLRDKVNELIRVINILSKWIYEIEDE